MGYATKEQLQELMQHISDNIRIPTIGIGGGYAPIGTIIAYMGITAPQDYLICDGATYNIADYRQLADFIATQFGSINYFGGDGTTTFAVPDLRGEFLRGTGTNSHENQGSGSDVGVHQNGTELPNIYTTTNALVTPNGASAWINTDSNIGTVSQYRSYGEGTAYTSSIPNKRTTRPTNTSVLYCIKAVAAGDVYSTEERVVGTWIDGKPLYQKTLFIDNPTTDWSLQSYGISNLSKVINVVNKMYLMNTGNTAVLEWYRSTTDYLQSFYNNLGYRISIAGATINNVTFTIQYTKATD